MSKTVLFQAIQFSISAQFKCLTVLFDPLIKLYQVLPLWAKVNLGGMAMKRYLAFPKTPTLWKPRHQMVWCHIQDTRWGGVLTPQQRCSRCILKPQLTGPCGINYSHIIIYEQIYRTHRWDPNRYYQPGSEWTWK